MPTKNRNILLLMLPATAVLILIASCGGTYRATQLHKPSLEERERVIYKNWDMKASVGVIEVTEGRVNGMLQARAKFKNLMGKTLNLEIKVKFLDNQGYEIDSPAPWYPFPMESGEIRAFEQVASSPNAIDFRIILQRAGSGD